MFDPLSSDDNVVTNISRVELTVVAPGEKE